MFILLGKKLGNNVSLIYFLLTNVLSSYKF